MKTLQELEKLTDNELRAMLAELCNYVRRPDGFWQEKGHVGSCGIPNYPQDLNACHEVEKCLLPDDAYYSQRNFYALHLGQITSNDNGRGWKPLSNDDCFPILHATARQRTIALIICLQNLNA